jgi:hypothetical protein
MEDRIKMNTRTKLLLTVGVVGAIGVLLAVGTSAFFSTSATSGTNVAATGNMSLAGGTGVYFDSGAGDGYMKPATSLANAQAATVTVTGSTTVSNSGNLPTDLTLKQTIVGGTGLGTGTGRVNGTEDALFTKAQLCITQTAPVAGAACGIYSGNFDMAPASGDPDAGDSVASNTISLGTFQPADSATYTFEVWLPNDADTDNDYQDQVATAQFQFDGS